MHAGDERVDAGHPPQHFVVRQCAVLAGTDRTGAALGEQGPGVGSCPLPRAAARWVAAICWRWTASAATEADVAPFTARGIAVVLADPLEETGRERPTPPDAA
ncbi:hypothetical protein [Streptomyces rubrogriseus]|uniref:Uncharacterized protein n=1 Tax=Streptomyces rubrogriseus TaxID=194673 RepID=A0A6G3TFS9_9ACTN|nr:hypothetical protein [Streptomyces rubrogriseus]NEC35305.1 hypothetical protein [Streptomyces rubrogriseus]